MRFLKDLTLLFIVVVFASVAHAEKRSSCRYKQDGRLKIEFVGPAVGTLKITSLSSKLCRSRQSSIRKSVNRKAITIGNVSRRLHSVTFTPKNCGTPVVKSIDLSTSRSKRIVITNNCFTQHTLPTATPTPTFTPTPTATPTPTQNGSNALPSCSNANGGVLSLEARAYSVTETRSFDCNVFIKVGTTITFAPETSLIFQKLVIFEHLQQKSEQRIFFATLPNRTTSTKKWWYSPVQFSVPQEIYPEWFGAKKTCNKLASAPCYYSDSSEGFQLAVNSFPQANASTVKSKLITAQPYTAPSNASDYYYYRFLTDVIVTRSKVEIDLRDNFIHSTRNVRFVIDGDRNGSPALNDMQGRDALNLERLYSTASLRKDHALNAFTLKRVNFGIPRSTTVAYEDSENASGIATLTWAKDSHFEDIQRVGPGGSALNLRVCNDCSAKNIHIYGGAEGNLVLEKKNEIPTQFRWVGHTIGVLAFLSNRMEIDGLTVANGPFFAAVQIKGGERNKVKNSTLSNLSRPEFQTHRCTVGTQTFFKPLNQDCEGRELSTSLSVVYGSMTGFWDRGDAPYIPSQTATQSTRPSYPFDGLGFGVADERRESKYTEFTNLSVIDSPFYTAFRTQESFETKYENINAHSVAYGVHSIRNRTQTTSISERGNTLSSFDFSDVIYQGVRAEITGTKPAGVSDDTSLLISASNGSIANRLPGNSYTKCYDSLPESLLSVGGVNCR